MPQLQGASPSQQKAFDSAMAGHNLFITGEAGSGKSWLIQRIIEALQNEGKRVLPEAPTGIAAIELDGGTTMHRTHAIPIDIVETLSKRASPTQVLRVADVIIIDEISMARIDVFEYAMKTIEATGRNIQVIVVGDFCQLPPVSRPEDREMYEMLKGVRMGKGYCFESEYWAKMKFETHYLKEAQRQKDTQFLQALNRARYGDTTCLGYFNQFAGKKPEPDMEYVYLVGQNRKADEKNEQELAKLPTRQYDIPTNIFGKVNRGDMRVADVLSLKKGARVMILINDKEDMYSNGTIGTVEHINIGAGYVTVRLPDGHTVDIEPYTWSINKYKVEDGEMVKEVIGSYTQFPLRLAWAITIHKSQGQTFDSAIIDPACWEEGQLYVALSRVRDSEGLILTKPIQAQCLKADATVQNFYRDFRWQRNLADEEGYSLVLKDRVLNIETPTNTGTVHITGDEENVAKELPAEGDKLTTKLIAQVLVEYEDVYMDDEYILGIVRAQTKRAMMLASIRKKVLA